MNEKLDELISEIPESTDSRIFIAAWHLLVSSGWGAFVATSVIFLGLVSGRELTIDLANLIAAILLVGMTAWLVCLAIMVLIGGPLTVLLRALRVEYALLYGFVGLGAGVLVIGLVLDGFRFFGAQAVIIPASGALAGFAAAWRWGRWREQVAAARQQRFNAPPEKRNNPIHDLIH